MSDKLPGKGWFGWLGRQIGYVSKAVRTEPLATPPAKPSAAQRAEPDEPKKTDPPSGEPAGAVLYRQGQVQEAEHPSQPGVKLRRTIIDEVIVEPDEPPQAR
jgi:hypothetical protein